MTPLRTVLAEVNLACRSILLSLWPAPRTFDPHFLPKPSGSLRDLIKSNSVLNDKRGRVLSDKEELRRKPLSNPALEENNDALGTTKSLMKSVVEFMLDGYEFEL